MSNQIQVDSFYKYLISNGYYFDKELIENYLLSLKVKPFVILTGNSGTGKTKLSQLFARYLNGIDYHKTKVTTRARSWGFKKKDNTEGHNGSWSLIYEYAKDMFPLDYLQGNYEIEVGGNSSSANFNLTAYLDYDKDNEELKNYFKKLYFKEEEAIQKDEKLGIKHEKQLVDLFIDCKGISSVLSKDSFKNNDITITMNNIDSFLKGNVQLSFEFFDYVPINRKTDCNIFANGIHSSAYFSFKYRISNYLTPDIKKYLINLKNNGEKKFELKIKGFSSDISNFKHNWDLVKILNSGIENNDNFCLVPVGANWTDNSNIIGYHNVITDDYQSTPAYDFIKGAHIHKDSPYFLILDEMNLSHVERYFADFLSAIESGEEILLYGNENNLKLPDNLFIIGTVNIDETTYMFSPKVLDRSNTIEFDTLLAKDYMAIELSEDDFNGDINYLQSPLRDSDISNLNIAELKNKLSRINCDEDNLWDILAEELTLFQETLKGSGFDFGFRVINEILRFMLVAYRYENPEEEWINWERYFDAQIKQKILPKLHGSEKAIGNVLTNLFNLCLIDRSNNENPKNFNITKENSCYYTSAVKLQNMVKVLSDQRYVSFIN